MGRGQGAGQEGCLELLSEQVTIFRLRTFLLSKALGDTIPWRLRPAGCELAQWPWQGRSQWPPHLPSRTQEGPLHRPCRLQAGSSVMSEGEGQLFWNDPLVAWISSPRVHTSAGPQVWEQQTRTVLLGVARHLFLPWFSL